MPAALEISRLRKAYGGRAVVDGLDLTAPAGEVTAVLGPNGAGKTTTIECCEGLRRPDGGTIRVLGLDPIRDARRVRARVGVMLQDGGLPLAARAGSVLRHFAALHATPLPVAGLAERLALGAFEQTPVRHLSGGQRQRLALACAVVGRPELVFLDEPSAGLDPQARLAVWDLVRELRSEGTSIVLTTHQMVEAETLADRVAIIDHGRVIGAGSPAALRAGAGSPAGGDRVVHFAGPPGLAAGINEALPRLRVDEPRPGTYLAWARASGGAEPAGNPADGGDGAVARAIADLAGWAVGAGALLTGFEPRPRSLEDVFLHYTGRELR